MNLVTADRPAPKLRGREPAEEHDPLGQMRSVVSVPAHGVGTASLVLFAGLG
jgi:hypothetical protein